MFLDNNWVESKRTMEYRNCVFIQCMLMQNVIGNIYKCINA